MTCMGFQYEEGKEYETEAAEFCNSGFHACAKGVKGSYLVLADWIGNEENYWTQTEWELKGAKMVQVDGERIKENTWYTMVNGEIKEVNEDDD